MNLNHGAGQPAPSQLPYEVKTMRYIQIDPRARLDIESLTELWDNENYSINIGAIGPQVYELLNELLISSQLALAQTERVKTESFKFSHEWGLNGKKALEAIREIARDFAKEEIIKAKSVKIEIQPERENSLWAEVLVNLNDQEKKIVLLSTTPLVNETKTLSVKEIAQALKTKHEIVRKTIEDAEDKIRRHLSKQILTRGGQ